MKIKTLIKLLVPPFITNIYHKCKIKKINLISTINQIQHTNNSLYIIGNGPSLDSSLKIYKKNMVINDCMVVNLFCNTALFNELKPRYYVIADPSKLSTLENLLEDDEKETIEITEHLQAVNWELNLIVPDFAISGYLVKKLTNHKFVKIYFYNTKNYIKYTNKMQNWLENCIEPPATTVLNTCVYLGIFFKYDEINILGMDLSWHEDLELDQKTNTLYIIDKHFYGTTKRLAILGNKPARVHEYLQCSVNAMKDFIELREFADENNVKVYNLSPHSWVDAFERK